MTKRSGTAARRNSLVMLPFSCFAGLQLEDARRTVGGARKVVFQHSAIHALSGIAAGGCKMHSASGASCANSSESTKS